MRQKIRNALPYILIGVETYMATALFIQYHHKYQTFDLFLGLVWALFAIDDIYKALKGK